MVRAGGLVVVSTTLMCEIDAQCLPRTGHRKDIVATLSTSTLLTHQPAVTRLIYNPPSPEGLRYHGEVSHLLQSLCYWPAFLLLGRLTQ
jgi:hypothetical protein